MKYVFLAMWCLCESWTVMVCAAEGPNIPFHTYDGYFVSNRFEPRAAESFAVLADQQSFDKIFGVAAIMHDRSHRLPNDIFESNLVLTAIRRGSSTWQFQVRSVTLQNGVVSLRYTSEATRSDSATFACPLMVSIPKGDYAGVRFIENGKLLKTITAHPARNSQ